MLSIKQTHEKPFWVVFSERQITRNQNGETSKETEEINQTKRGFHSLWQIITTKEKESIEERGEEDELLMRILFDIGSSFLHQILHNLKVFLT